MKRRGLGSSRPTKGGVAGTGQSLVRPREVLRRASMDRLVGNRDKMQEQIEGQGGDSEGLGGTTY